MRAVNSDANGVVCRMKGFLERLALGPRKDGGQGSAALWIGEEDHIAVAACPQESGRLRDREQNDEVDTILTEAERYVGAVVLDLQPDRRRKGVRIARHIAGIEGRDPIPL